MIDIVDFGFAVGKAYQVFDDLDNVTLCERLLLKGQLEIELAVDLVTAYFAEVVTFVAEKQLIDDTAGGITAADVVRYPIWS